MDNKIFQVLDEFAVSMVNGQVPENKFWNITPDAGRFVNILTFTIRAKRVLEIGTSNGYSGLWFAEALSHTGGKLYTVESHRGRFLLAQENFVKAGVQQWVNQIFGHAPEIFLLKPEILDEPFDLIFFDATKMEYESYLELLLPHLRVGGILLADNVISHRDALSGFLDKLKNHRGLNVVEIPLGGGLILAMNSEV